ncbi:MAG: ABC transporter permease [Candidatus Sulfotelmatobacter sp.]
MHGLTQNVRYSLRQTRKSPGFTAITVITLALGIGGNSAIFGVINAVMLRTLPVKDPGRLVLLKWKAKSIPETKASSSYANCPPGSGPLLEGGGDIISDVPLDSGGCSFSFPFLEQVQNERNIFSDVAAFVPAELSVNSEGRTSREHGLFVSGDFFSTIGVRPAAGRLLDQHDDSQAAPPSIVVSHRFWQSKLSGNGAVLGKQILIGRTLFTVVGVTAPEFAQLDPGLACDLWLPLAFKAKVPPYAPKETAADAIWIELIGRLKPKTSTGQAASALSAAFAASTTTGPEAILKTADAPQIELVTAAHGLATLRRNFSQALFALLAAVALVLLISCVNIAGLMLARSGARRKELGIRVALGATRGRIISQLLTESLLLAFMGGAVGMALGVFGSRILVSFFSRNWSMPLQLDAHPDARVFVFTLLVSVAVGVAFGLIPAFFSSRPDLVSTLKAESGSAMAGVGRSVAVGSLIVITQIALAMPVLAAAGLVARTLANLRAEDVGFNPQHLLVFRIDSTYTRKNPDTLYRDLQQQLRSLPGVVSVSRSGVALLSNEGMAAPIVSNDQPGLEVRAHGLPMSSDFLTTMGIPLREGRIFDDGEAERARGKNDPTQVVVNETLVRQLFGFRDPLGKYFHLGNASGPTYEIIGVVGDAKYGNVRDTIWPTVYTPLGDWNDPMYFEVRTAMEPNALIREIQSAINGFDSNLLIVGMKTEGEQIDEDLYQERLISVLSGLFAALALTVACIGLYGLLSFQFACRTQEIGIRLALGAEREDVVRLVLGRGAVLAIVGTLTGFAAALAITRYSQSFLFGVKPADPLTLVAVAALLVAVALIASYIPARRAAKVDPMVALRYE